MKIMRLLLVLFVVLGIYYPVHAEELTYQVTDAKTGFSEGFSTYSSAYDFYEDNLDTYDNLLLYKDNKLINMEYGIVEFSDETIEYYSSSRSTKDYICGAYGIDAAYISTSDDLERVYFKISGDIGYTSINNVELRPLESLGFVTSHYETRQGYLYHNIVTQLDYQFYTYSIVLDVIPEFMKDDHIYYSYDGHYFYSEYSDMIDDYRQDSYDNAINENPYYNYYQFLPSRSISNYTYEELNDYFENTLGINSSICKYTDYDGDGANDRLNESMLYKNIDEFFNCQSLYGTNALMLIASSIEESSYGKSLDAYLNNNVYENAVYETSYEAENQRYNSIANSIRTHSKYFISDRYSNYLSSSYVGTNFGNKLGGINVEYSLDTYYGEKCASECFKIDRALGYKDYNSLKLCVVTDEDKMSIYKDNELNPSLIKLEDIAELSFVVLEDNEYVYKVQIDPSFNSDYIYDFDSSVGYISFDYVDYLSDSKAKSEYDLKSINYDFNGGKYCNKEKLELNVLKQDNVDHIKPYQEGYEFVDYSDVIDEDGNEVKVANYRQIDSIDVQGLFETQGKLLPYPNIESSSIVVHYADGKSSKKPLTMDNISKYGPNNFEAQEIVVTYNGVSTSFDIQISEDYYDAYDSFVLALNNKDCSYLKNNIDSVYYPLSMDDIRDIDGVLKKDNNRNYVIKDHTGKYNISVSGLDLSIDDRRNFSLIEDTYYVDITSINIGNNATLSKFGSGYGLKDIEGINIACKFNYQKLNLRGPVVIQMDFEGKTINDIYTVYHIDSNGNIYKCRTSQSKDYIQFIIYETGDYLILKKDSVNTYNIENGIENLNYENMGFDNNRTNIEFLVGLFVIMLALIGILIYYRVLNMKERKWNDYKKSLLRADAVQEEKQKN